MAIYGYARTSTVDQAAGLADQVEKLINAGCAEQEIFREQVSSVALDERLEFKKVLALLMPGDVLVFCNLSRAARSMIHMVEIESRITAAGATMRILDLAIDTATPSGRLTFNLFASIAQFERENMLERQKVGIAAAKARNVYKGRSPTARAKASQIAELSKSGLSKKAIANACSVGVASVYRILRDLKNSSTALQISTLQ